MDRHLRAARGAGIVPTVVECEGLGLDIDTPADLRALLEAPMISRAQSFLVNAGIAARVGARPTGAADALGAVTS
jgi:2-phospho-L-lactate guanylyltransferase (CobY/MobA/RfbA family)